MPFPPCVANGADPASDRSMCRATERTTLNRIAKPCGNAASNPFWQKETLNTEAVSERLVGWWNERLVGYIKCGDCELASTADKTSTKLF
jgi:hypothetical protein